MLLGSLWGTHLENFCTVLSGRLSSLTISHCKIIAYYSRLYIVCESYKRSDVLLKLYKSLVRPHLEYYCVCVSAWSPYYQKDKHLLERIQHRFTRTRMIPGMKQLRGETGTVKFVVIGRKAEPSICSKSLKCSRDSHRYHSVSSSPSAIGHSAKINKFRTSLDIRRFFFSERVVNRWNLLHQKDIDSTTLNSFKNCLQQRRKAEMGFFTASSVPEIRHRSRCGHKWYVTWYLVRNFKLLAGCS